MSRLIEHKNQEMVTPSDTFLGFGNGRHACAGRFFASQEMKLMLAHVVTHYDVRIEGGRPKNFNIVLASTPTDKAEILVRRRKL